MDISFVKTCISTRDIHSSLNRPKVECLGLYTHPTHHHTPPLQGRIFSCISFIKPLLFNFCFSQPKGFFSQNLHMFGASPESFWFFDYTNFVFHLGNHFPNPFDICANDPREKDGNAICRSDRLHWDCLVDRYSTGYFASLIAAQWDILRLSLTWSRGDTSILWGCVSSQWTSFEFVCFRLETLSGENQRRFDASEKAQVSSGWINIVGRSWINNYYSSLWHFCWISSWMLIMENDESGCSNRLFIRRCLRWSLLNETSDHSQREAILSRLWREHAQDFGVASGLTNKRFSTEKNSRDLLHCDNNSVFGCTHIAHRLRASNVHDIVSCHAQHGHSHIGCWSWSVT